jgi:hypothetical protein
MNNDGIVRIRQYTLGWVGLPFVAMLNGILRELTYCKAVGTTTAHQISTVMLSMTICVYVILYNSRVQLKNTREAMVAGFIWMILTVMFEFILSSALGVPILEQFSRYNILAGNLWVLIPVTVFVAPVIFRGHRLIRFFG